MFHLDQVTVSQLVLPISPTRCLICGLTNVKPGTVSIIWKPKQLFEMYRREAVNFPTDLLADNVAFHGVLKGAFVGHKDNTSHYSITGPGGEIPILFTDPSPDQFLGCFIKTRMDIPDISIWRKTASLPRSLPISVSSKPLVEMSYLKCRLLLITNCYEVSNFSNLFDIGVPLPEELVQRA